MIAIVPARGGSKGLPGKNIKDFHGKPLIAYTIIEALKSKSIDDIIVSTDNQEIADIAQQYGAKNLFLRPDSLATDTALAVDNYIYTVDRLNKEFNYHIKDFSVLLPTSPLRIADDIDNAVELFYKKNADSVVSYTEEARPVIWHKYLDPEGRFVPIFQDELKNRQDYKLSYYPDGAVYVFKFDLIKKKLYYSENSYAYVIPKERSSDIDNIEDFEYAEFLYSKRISKK